MLVVCVFLIPTLYTRMHTHIQTHKHTHKRTHKHTHTQTHTLSLSLSLSLSHTHTHSHTHSHVCTHTHTHMQRLGGVWWTHHLSASFCYSSCVSILQDKGVGFSRFHAKKLTEHFCPSTCRFCLMVSISPVNRRQ